MIEEIVNNILIVNLSLEDYIIVTKYISELKEINKKLKFKEDNRK